jgi:NTE family protein
MRDPILVDLALQGGGAHGAFTWGVLDRFLGEPWLEIDGISGTSAGAMNAVVLDLAVRLAGAKNVAEAMELQAAYWRKQLSELATQAGEMRTLSTEMTADVAAPIWTLMPALSMSRAGG